MGSRRILRGGEGGIRTRGGVAPTHAFQACSFGLSDTSPRRSSVFKELAERKGFEPLDLVKGQRFSRPPRSTTPAPLLITRIACVPLTSRVRITPSANADPALRFGRYTAPALPRKARGLRYAE